MVGSSASRWKRPEVPKCAELGLKLRLVRGRFGSEQPLEIVPMHTQRAPRLIARELA